MENIRFRYTALGGIGFADPDTGAFAACAFFGQHFVIDQNENACRFGAGRLLGRFQGLCSGAESEDEECNSAGKVTARHGSIIRTYSLRWRGPRGAAERFGPA